MTDERNKKNNAVDLDTAITLAGLGKFHVGLAIVSGGCIASATADAMGNGLLLPSVTCEMKLSAADKGLYSGASFLGMISTTYAWGSASDTFGRRKALLLSLGLSWLSSFSASFAPVFWLLIALRFLAGLASSALAATVYAYMSEFFPPKLRAKYLSWAGVIVGSVYFMMPACAWLILPITWSLDLGFVVITSWRILSLLNGFSLLVAFFGLLALPESPKYLVSIDKSEEAIDVLRKIFSMNTERPEDEYPVKEIRKTVNDVRTVGIEAKEKLSLLSILKTMKDQMVPILGRKHINTTILGSVLQFFILASSCGFYVWIPDILNRLVTYNALYPNSTGSICDAIEFRLPATASNDTCQKDMNTKVFVGNLGLGVYYTMTYVLIASLMNLVGKRSLLSILQLVSGMACFAFYWSTDFTLATIYSTVYIVQSGVCIIPLNTMFSDLYPTHLRSAALCVAMTLGRFGSSLFGVMIGVLLEYDCTSTIFGMGAASIGTGILIFLLPTREKMIELIT